MDQKAPALDGYSLVNGASRMFYNRRPPQNGCSWARPEPMDHSRHFRMAEGRHSQDLYIWDNMEGVPTSSPSDLPNMDNSPGPLTPGPRRWNPSDMSPVPSLNNSNNPVPNQSSALWPSRPPLNNKDSHSPMSSMEGLIRSTQAPKDNPAEGGMGRPVSVPSSHMYSTQPPSVSRHDTLLHPHHGMNSTPPSSLNPNAGPGLVVPQPLTVKVPRPNKTYHCRMCDQIFDSKSDLMVHSQHIHKQDPKPYKCQKCNKCFANSSYLSQHARIHLGIKPYKCQICERKFTQLCHLQQHMRTHTGEKPYKCQHPGCGKAFTQLSNLQSHSRSHMTDKPYRCNSCYKCYSDEQSLREHIPKHSETKHLKTHICHICGKSYTQETYLTRHMAKHSFDNRGPPLLSKQVGLCPPQMPPDHQQDVKPLIEGNNGVPTPDSAKPSSAFMPLAHQYPGPNMINSSVPSNFPFPPAPRLPSSTLSSPLPHISSVSSSRAYFPFDPTSFPKREPIERSLSVSREGMIANSLLSLQQIKNYTSSHPMFSKSEPNSPVHNKEFS